MASVGANYVRNTMSQREEIELKPHRLLPEGRFNLDEWNEEYWTRFQNMLRWTQEREIIVQIEVWDRFDFSRENWEISPWNPAMNVTYSSEESGFSLEYPNHPGKDSQPFFHTIPEMDNNQLILDYQHAFADYMLSFSLQYDHILYCMDNETSTSAGWGAYWAKRIKRTAEAMGTEVELTEMWDNRTLDAPCYNHTVEDSSLYSFVEVSQNNHNQNRFHWDNLRAVCDRVDQTGNPRPINNVKIYGASTGPYGRNRDGLERMWRNLLGGAAASRYHRPPSGLGLSNQAKAHIKSLRMFTDELDFFNCEPHQDLLGGNWRDRNDAYCVAIPGQEYGLFYTDGGMVSLNLSPLQEVKVRWLDVSASEWQSPVTIRVANGQYELQTPDDGYWAVVLKPK